MAAAAASGDSRWMYYPVPGSKWRQMKSGTQVEVFAIDLDEGIVTVKFYNRQKESEVVENVRIEDFIEYFERSPNGK